MTESARRCPGCNHAFEAQDATLRTLRDRGADPFCSSCVESGTRDAYHRGYAAAMKQVEPALFKMDDIVVSKPTRTGCTVRDVVWVPRYGIQTYNGYRSVLSQGQARLELEPQHEPVVNSVWWAPEREYEAHDKEYGSEWRVETYKALAEGGPMYVAFEGVGVMYLADYVKLHFSWVSEP